MAKLIKYTQLVIMASGLSACGHYQYLQDNPENTSENTLNRYSHNSMAILATHNTEAIETQATSVANDKQLKPNPERIIKLNKTATKMAYPSNKLTSHYFAKKLPQADQPIWDNFLHIFTAEKVKPWQKATLAKATMKPGGLNPDSEKFNQKIYASKESSRGGLGVAGGGCGCN